jgi:drug/metabolite transporter (DMT)-like permease
MSTDSATSSIRTALSSITDGGPASWLILAGAVLFVIPEPITSVLGVLVILAGLVVWGVESLL